MLCIDTYAEIHSFLDVVNFTINITNLSRLVLAAVNEIYVRFEIKAPPCSFKVDHALCYLPRKTFQRTDPCWRLLYYSRNDQGLDLDKYHRCSSS
jgi:hypothetical protein